MFRLIHISIIRECTQRS